MGNRQRAHQLAMMLFKIDDRQMRTQSSKHIKEGCTCRIQQEVLDHQVGLGKNSSRTEEEGRRRDVTRNHGLNRLKLLATSDRDHTAATREFSTKGAQC